MSFAQLRPWLIGIVLVVVGMTLAGVGLMAQARPRTNDEDLTSWRVWGLGMFLLGTGVSIPFMRPRHAMLIGLAFPRLGFTCLVLYAWGYIILNAILKGAFS